MKAARVARDDAKRARTAGTNPVQQRKAEKLAKSTENATTYEAVAREFHASKAPGWSATHARQWLRCSEKDLFPWLGGLPVAGISAPLLLDVLRKVEARGAFQLAHEIREFAGMVITPQTPLHKKAAE